VKRNGDKPRARLKALLPTCTSKAPVSAAASSASMRSSSFGPAPAAVARRCGALALEAALFAAAPPPAQPPASPSGSRVSSSPPTAASSSAYAKSSAPCRRRITAAGSSAVRGSSEATETSLQTGTCPCCCCCWWCCAEQSLRRLRQAAPSAMNAHASTARPSQLAPHLAPRPSAPPSPSSSPPLPAARVPLPAAANATPSRVLRTRVAASAAVVPGGTLGFTLLLRASLRAKVLPVKSLPPDKLSRLGRRDPRALPPLALAQELSKLRAVSVETAVGSARDRSLSASLSVGLLEASEVLSRLASSAASSPGCDTAPALPCF